MDGRLSKHWLEYTEDIHYNDFNLLNSNLGLLVGCKTVYKDVGISASTWTTLSFEHGLGRVPKFILASPYTTVSGRFIFKTRASTTAMYIDIYNLESSAFSVGFYILYN